ncbi:MAG: glycine--tRNA ligase subunit beta, partial [Candidatus Cloacimonetes bacterium]|nr:glycine--tRNA ligase subunit beta [Candidatus Cloacimonadota bacterium]
GDLGTLYDKTHRIRLLVIYFCKELRLSRKICKDSEEAAYYCKADLSTMMLGEKEYTKLQGYIGHHYALKSDINKNVALAIEEHYFPRNEKDNLPTAIEGSIVAIADKMDTVCGIIGVDMIPTGSKDPFALRRAGNGVVQIIANQNFEIDLYKLIDVTFDFLEGKLKKPENNKDVVYDFFKQRVNWLLKQKQFDYDIIDSVMHIDHSNIPDLVHRAKALQELKGEEEFIDLVLGFKRVSNIIAEVKSTSNVKQEIIQEEFERILYVKYLDLKIRIEKLLPNKNYKKILEELVEYGSTIDNFFDKVLVNVEDIEIKQNRYNILFCIRELFLQVADLSKLDY